MSLFDYQTSKLISAEDHPFYAIIMAAMRQGDTNNQRLLRDAWPHVWDELKARYNVPGGRLSDDE